MDDQPAILFVDPEVPVPPSPLDVAHAEWERTRPERIRIARMLFPRDPFAPYDPAFDGVLMPPCEGDE